MGLTRAAAAAQPVSETMGPYKVSFDPGLPASDYTVHVVPAVNDVGFAGTPYTRYSMRINKTADACSKDNMNKTFCYKSWSTITVYEYRALVSGDYIKSLTEHDLQIFVPLGYSEPLIMNRTIDNTSGIVGRCSKSLPDITRTQARYLLTPNGNGTSCEVVVVLGSGPRMDQGTESIIDTYMLRWIRDEIYCGTFSCSAAGYHRASNRDTASHKSI